MASKKAATVTKLTPKTAPVNGAIVSGLGETPEQLQQLTDDLAKQLTKDLKPGADAKAHLEIARKYGLAMKRHTRLQRKIGKAQEDE